MCLIILALHCHAQYPFVFAGNRDEFFGRATSPAGWWSETPGVLGGRDLEAGGTWMGVTTNGRLAAVTNYREHVTRSPTARSRGELVSQFLCSEASCSTYADQIATRASTYSGYSLLTGTGIGSPACEVWVDSNRTGAGATRLAQGIFGLSNGPPNAPWPKLVRARHGVERALRATDLERSTLAQTLLELLSDQSLADGADLPATGIAPELEHKLSAIFVRMPDYGTRTSTALIIDHRGAAFFIERTYDLENAPEERSFSFQIKSD